MPKQLVFILLGVGLWGMTAVLLSQSEGLSQNGSAVSRREMVPKDLASWSLFIQLDHDSPERSKVGWTEINVDNSGRIKIEKMKGPEEKSKIVQSDSKLLTQKETEAIFESARTFLNTFRIFNDDSVPRGDGARVTMELKSGGRRSVKVVRQDLRRHSDAGEGISALLNQLFP